MFDWVIYRPPKILNFQSEAKLEQINAIVTTHSVSLLINSFTYQNTRDKKRCFCNLCIAMNSNLLEENRTKAKSNATFNMKEVDLNEL